MTLVLTPAPAPRAAALAWNSALGLWGRRSPGHTRAVAHLPVAHSGVESAVKLHALLQLDLLDDDTVADAVSGLLALQSTSDPFTGCFRWYAEESEPIDTNASFFIGLALQLLALGHPERLSPDLRSRLDVAFARLNTWFLAELERESPVYPNKYLGDLVCAWLGHELLDQPAPPSLVSRFSEALTYWENEYWGWGEHQSDVYAGVLLTELSALLLFARTLPNALRVHATRLTASLLAIDDAYGAGPRVPQIRCYDFNQAPARAPFRAQVAAWPSDADLAWADARSLKRYMLLPFGPLFARRGWTSLFPSCAPASTTGRAIHVPLAGGAHALGWVAPTLRTGVLSAWPILPGAEHQGWGLSWQTFPAAFWRPAGDWGFLRFTTRVGEDLRAHPAMQKARAYLSNALGPGEPPPVGRTVGAQQGADWIALRALPACEAWDDVSDGFWFYDLAVAPIVERATPAWSTLLLPHPDGDLRLHHLAPRPSAPPFLVQHPTGAWSWTVTGAAHDQPFVHLWSLETGSGGTPGAPRLDSAANGSVRIHWEDTQWHGKTLPSPNVLSSPPPTPKLPA